MQERDIKKLPNDNGESALVPYEVTTSKEDIEVFLSSAKEELTKTESLRSRFVGKYAEHLVHELRVSQLRPSEQEDPEGYTQWMESNTYLESLAQKDMRTASIIKRLTTPVNERINRNTPQQHRVNKWGNPINEYGRDLWLHPHKEEDEFEELERMGKLYEGIEVPINRLQTLEILELFEEEISSTGFSLIVADIQFDGRDGGVMYRADGTEIYAQPNIHAQMEYKKEEDRVEEQVREISEAQIRYVNLLPASEQKNGS